MKHKQKLYKFFIELTRVLIQADSTISKKNRQIIEAKVARHPWAKSNIGQAETAIAPSENVQIIFNQLVANCEKNGIDREYEFFVDVVKNIVAAGSKNKVAEDILGKLRIEIDRIYQSYATSPSLLNVLLEGRLLFEWSSIYFLQPFIPKRIQGGNHPVLLLPPFLGTDSANTFISKYLKQQGFETYKWELGINLIRSYYLAPLEDRLNEIFEQHQEKVSLVGWSGGGMLAKILANRHPDKVAQLVTLGTPVWGLNSLKTRLSGLYETLRGKRIAERSEPFQEELEAIPDVPITCIYTKTDGIVPWRHCLEAETLRDDIQNIEVYGSHSGLGVNPSVLLAVANALYQNLQGEVVDEIPPQIEKVLYPKFWQKTRTQLLGGLFS